MTATFLLDAPSLVYRAYFALPTTLTDAQGRPVNAVRGFLEMVTRILIDHRPERLVSVFDGNWRPDFRVAAYPGYKAARPEDPPDLPRQFDVLEAVLDAAGISRAVSYELEADDAIATLVERLEPGERAIVVTGDRDLLALVEDPAVRVLFPVRGTKEMTEFDEAAVVAKYKVAPKLYPVFATLRGDASDGLPGVAGIGPKRAADLLERFGSIDGIVAAVDELPPRQASALKEANDYLEAMKTVVTLVRDADVETTPTGDPDEETLRKLGAEHNLGSSTVRLLQALRGER
ncbi:MAG TPA: 5'-3' exonuclease [Actinomycetota bacterium]|nr:5'-3' exonuclease [Actinomycetota bacterium]